VFVDRKKAYYAAKDNGQEMDESYMIRKLETSVRANFSYKAILLGHPIAAPPFSYSGII
jgi:hypothetical protein